MYSQQPVSKVWDYETLDNQYSDQYAKIVDNYLEGSPIKVLSKLPVKIYVTVQRGLKVVMETTIESRNYVFLPYDKIENGDLINFYYDPTGKNDGNFDNLRHVAPTHSITTRHGTILVGNVSSVNKTYKRDISPGRDLSSINVHNMLPWDLTILKGVKPVMYVQKNQNLDNVKYNGNITISPSVYYDDLNQGVDIGTSFNVYANTKFGKPTMDINKLTYLFSFTINDIDEDRIIIGVVSSVIDRSIMTGVNSKNSGRAIYRLGNDDPYGKTPIFTPGRNSVYAFNEKYGKGTDKHRNTFGSNERSTVETARYKQLSGANVLRGNEIR